MHSDHHPLTETEVAELLVFLKKHPNVYDHAKVAVRLTQAIPDMTCPQPAEGEMAAEKQLKLERLLADRSQEGATSELVAAVMALLK